MLENEKYTGSVKLLDSVNKENYYLLKDNHEAIITWKYLVRFKKKNQVGVILMRRIIERVENIVQKIKLWIVHQRITQNCRYK